MLSAAAIRDCVIQIVRTANGMVGAIFTLIGALKDVFGIEAIPFPGWVWWLAAIVLLFFTAVRLQMKLDTTDGPHIGRLRNKSYVTFGEIAAAIVKSNPAFDKGDIIRQLTRSIDRGDFESWTGHSRVRVIQYDEQMREAGPRPILQRSDFEHYVKTGEVRGPGVKAFRTAEIRAGLQRAAGGQQRPEEELVFDRADFRKCYRRFRDGKYER
jgi:hypothetical protein